jgi:hypothetical protein
LTKGLRSAVDRVGHENDAPARFEQVVDGLGHPFPLGAVERLAEGHQPECAEGELRDLFRQGLNPLDVGDLCLFGMASSCDEHVDIGVQTDDLVEEWREFDGKDAGTAPDVEEPAGAIDPHSTTTVSR